MNNWIIKWGMRQSDLMENCLNERVYKGHL